MTALIMAPFGQCQTTDNDREALSRFHDAHRNANPFGLRPSDRLLQAAPLFHSAELNLYMNPGTNLVWRL